MSRRGKILAKTASMYVGNKVDSIKNFFKADKVRVDKDLPLDMRINAGINITGLTSVFVINRDKLVMKKPKSTSGRIIAISTADLSEEENGSLMQYRAFILPDGGTETDVYVLEIG
ncbi:MAG: hypothetical protein U9Q66_00585, partial [Patescibacteria group bacterium]|nr:hypothetical protein [Patescibacteria group bacterium]